MATVGTLIPTTLSQWDANAQRAVFTQQLGGSCFAARNTGFTASSKLSDLAGTFWHADSAITGMGFWIDASVPTINRLSFITFAPHLADIPFPSQSVVVFDQIDQNASAITSLISQGYHPVSFATSIGNTPSSSAILTSVIAPLGQVYGDLIETIGSAINGQPTAGNNGAMLMLEPQFLNPYTGQGSFVGTQNGFNICQTSSGCTAISCCSCGSFNCTSGDFNGCGCPGDQACSTNDLLFAAGVGSATGTGIAGAAWLLNDISFNYSAAGTPGNADSQLNNGVLLVSFAQWINVEQLVTTTTTIQATTASTAQYLCCTAGGDGYSAGTFERAACNGLSLVPDSQTCVGNPQQLGPLAAFCASNFGQPIQNPPPGGQTAVARPGCAALCATGSPTFNLPTNVCDTTLSTYCASLIPVTSPPFSDLTTVLGQSDICGCHMPSGVYSNYFAQLPVPIAEPFPQCFFTPCVLSPLKQFGETAEGGFTGCPSINACFENVTVNNSGQVTFTGGFTVQQLEACVQSGGTSTGTGTGTSSSTSTSTTTSTATFTSTSTSTSTSSASGGGGFPIWLIILLVVLAVLLIGGLLLYFLLRNRGRGTATTAAYTTPSAATAATTTAEPLSTPSPAAAYPPSDALGGVSPIETEYAAPLQGVSPISFYF